MARIKEITVSFKKGMPNYSSVSSSVTMELQEGDDLKKAWEEARSQAWFNCTPDPDWLSNPQTDIDKYLAGKEAKQ